jgi:hypothetical protein
VIKRIKTKGDTIVGPIAQGRTWTIARDGVFRNDGKYFIAANRLWNENDGHTLEDQIEGKQSAEYDFEEFIEIIKKAREIHAARKPR